MSAVLRPRSQQLSYVSSSATKDQWTFRIIMKDAENKVKIAPPHDKTNKMTDQSLQCALNG